MAAWTSLLSMLGSSGDQGSGQGGGQTLTSNIGNKKISDPTTRGVSNVFDPGGYLTEMFGLTDKPEGPEPIQLPDFYTDKYYQPVQDQMYQFGTGAMEGKIPDYYKPLTESGGPEFENYLKMVGRDVSRGVTEDMARRNISGPAGTDTIARTMADVSTKGRWDDWMRSLSGKKAMLGEGIDALQGVRTAGLQYGDQKNRFNLAETGIGMDATRMMMNQQNRESDDWNKMMSSSIGSISNIYGMKLLGDDKDEGIPDQTRRRGSADMPEDNNFGDSINNYGNNDSMWDSLTDVDWSNF